MSASPIAQSKQQVPGSLLTPALLAPTEERLNTAGAVWKHGSRYIGDVLKQRSMEGGRVRLRSWLHALFIFFAMACMVLLLPILLPVGIVSNARERRRLLVTVSGFACLVCGTTLDDEAVRLADEEHEGRIKDLIARGFRPRIVRTCVAICKNCGARYGLDEETSTLRLVNPEGDA